MVTNSLTSAPFPVAVATTTAKVISVGSKVDMSDKRMLPPTELDKAGFINPGEHLSQSRFGGFKCPIEEKFPLGINRPGGQL